MLLRTEHLRLAADHLADAVRRLRPHGEAGVNYDVGGLGAGGDIVADLFVQDQHSYDLGGKLRARAAVLDWLPDGSPVEDERESGERLALWLPAEYTEVDDDGYAEVDTWRVLTEAAAGRSPVLPQPRPREE